MLLPRESVQRGAVVCRAVIYEGDGARSPGRGVARRVAGGEVGATSRGRGHS